MNGPGASISTPEWVRHAVFYQIFPDRFARHEGDDGLGKLHLETWQSPPTSHGFKGGNFQGITRKLPYLKDLGITAIYLTPIFQSACNHRYHTHDYYQVDPLLGGNQAFRDFLDAAHREGMRVVLDGVFNHASRGFYYFNDLLENGDKSPWKEWFFPKSFPLNAYETSSRIGEKVDANYECWWNLPALPKFNHDNPAVREYLMRVGEHWIKAGIDGWRLDVPEMVTAKGFWQEFRQRIKAINPDAYIVGEIWTDARSWLDGTQFDGVMNYLFVEAVLSFLGAPRLERHLLHEHFKSIKTVDSADYAAKIEFLLGLYHPEVLLSQLNLLDSHDTARFFTLVGEDVNIAKLAALLLFTFPGAPCIYYGDEVGLPGAPDPDCRRAFPPEDSWNKELLAAYKEFISLRKALPALQSGDFRTLHARGCNYAFMRSVEGQSVLAAINSAPRNEVFTVEAPAGKDFHVLSGGGRMASQGVRDQKLSLEISLPPFGHLLARA